MIVQGNDENQKKAAKELEKVAFDQLKCLFQNKLSSKKVEHNLKLIEDLDIKIEKYGVDAEFVVYLDLKNDMSFEMFQQLYTLEYEAYIGTYSLKGDVLKGSYITGQNWKSEYRIVSVSDSALELESIEENSITMVYAATTIPADIATTRSHSQGVEPLL